MKYEYKYTIIIPHRNIPNLLWRCLKSIPKRQDTQIIVVDDNSGEEYVEALEKLEKEFDYVQFLRLQSAGGGGKARNEGLKIAKGYYVLFADADDYFNYCIYQVLDEYKDSCYDAVFFKANSVDTDTYICATRCESLNKIIDGYKTNPSKAVFNLKYFFGEPWCKMVKHDIIIENGICFSETKIHNDTRFSYLVGHYSQDVFVDNQALYCVTERKNSVSKTLSVDALLTRTYVFSEATMFYRRHGMKMFGVFTFNPLYEFLSRGDIYNCKKCIAIMKSEGMPSQLIAYGFFRFCVGKVLHWPRILLNKIKRHK